MARKAKESLNVQCVLTDVEKLAYSKTLGEAIGKKQRAEDSLKSFNAQIKAEIAGHDAQINLLAEKINTGKEYRYVECEVKYDWKKKTRAWVRKDTGEIEKEDIIPEEELQEEARLEK